MKKLYYLSSIIIFALIFGLSVTELNAQLNEQKITDFQIKNPAKYTKIGELYITVNGKEKKIADYAQKALIINDGKEIIYTANDGAGGYENEGQSLYIYNPTNKHKQKILSQYYMVDALAEKKLSNGQIAILVRMSDGGLGASYFSVVDPNRGEVFFRSEAELLKINKDKITLGFYDDWEKIVQKREVETHIIPTTVNVKLLKKETHDLKQILRNEVIYNEVSHAFDPQNREGLKKVKVYFWRVNDYMPNQKYETAPVPRYVNPKAPLRPALEALFAEPNKNEEDYGFASATFELKFEGVTLKNGVATVKFSQSPDKRNHGTSGPFIFYEAVQRTALQFPTVKKVRLCGIGETFIDSELDKPFDRCSK